MLKFNRKFWSRLFIFIELLVIWFTFSVLPFISPQDDLSDIGSNLLKNWQVPLCGLIYIIAIISIHRNWHSIRIGEGKDKVKIIVSMVFAIILLGLPQWCVMFKYIEAYKVLSDIKYFIIPLLFLYIDWSIYTRLVAVSNSINRLYPPKK